MTIYRAFLISGGSSDEREYVGRRIVDSDQVGFIHRIRDEPRSELGIVFYTAADEVKNLTIDKIRDLAGPDHLSIRQFGLTASRPVPLVGQIDLSQPSQKAEIPALFRIL